MNAQKIAFLHVYYNTNPIGPPSPEAAAIVLSGLTACCALSTASLRAGETIAVTAAAGGTGHFAVQLAVQQVLDGSDRERGSVVAISGGASKSKALENLDPRIHVIDYHSKVDLNGDDIKSSS